MMLLLIQPWLNGTAFCPELEVLGSIQIISHISHLWGHEGHPGLNSTAQASPLRGILKDLNTLGKGGYKFRKKLPFFVINLPFMIQLLAKMHLFIYIKKSNVLDNIMALMSLISYQYAHYLNYTPIQRRCQPPHTGGGIITYFKRHAHVLQGNIFLTIPKTLFITLKSLGYKVVGSRIAKKSNSSFGKLLDEAGFELWNNWL